MDFDEIVWLKDEMITFIYYQSRTHGTGKKENLKKTRNA